METIRANKDGHDIIVVYGYPGKSLSGYNFETGKYSIYISKTETAPEVVLRCALEDIKRREGLVIA